jgi:hypothetical protein
MSAPDVYVTYRECAPPWKHDISFPTYRCCHIVNTTIRSLARCVEKYYREENEE